MIIQNIIFPTNNLKAEKLYYNVENGAASVSDDGICLSSNTKVSFFTYFNLLSAGKWKKYTGIDKFHLVLRGRGKCKLSIWNRDKLAKEIEIDLENKIDIELCCQDTQDIFGIFVETIEGCVLTGGYFSVNDNPVKDVFLAIGICTFKREEYVKNTLKIISENFLENDDSVLKNHLHIFVSDNGQTLKRSELENDAVSVLYNINAGGSGGFGRCIYEALNFKNDTKITHILLMDDDIIIEPEVLYRTYSFLSYVNKKYSDYIVGGSLLRMDCPTIIHENGALFSNGKIVSPKKGLDVSFLEGLFENDKETEVEYNGWWYCCIPFVNNTIELPLPIFIHGDDIEYGLRFEKKLITMNGLGVWHDSFENRKSSVNEYYDMRNGMICDAIHRKGYSKLKLFKRIASHMVGQLFRYRYDDQLLTIKALSDFLEGPDFLKTTDTINLHNWLMTQGYKQTDVSKLLSEANCIETVSNGFGIKHIISINGFLFPAKKQLTALPYGAHVSSLYRLKNVVLYDPDCNKGIVVKKRFGMLFVTLARCVEVAFMLATKYRKAEKKYADVYELKSKEFWERYLEI